MPGERDWEMEKDFYVKNNLFYKAVQFNKVREDGADSK